MAVMQKGKGPHVIMDTERKKQKGRMKEREIASKEEKELVSLTHSNTAETQKKGKTWGKQRRKTDYNILSWMLT